MMYKHECTCCGKVFLDSKKTRKYCSATCFGIYRSKLYENGLKEKVQYAVSSS